MEEKTLDDVMKGVAEVGTKIAGMETAAEKAAADISGLIKNQDSMRKELAALQQAAAAGIPQETAHKTFGEKFVSDTGFDAFKAAAAHGEAKFRLQLDKTAAPATTQASNSVSRTTLAAPAQLGLVTDPRQVLSIESLFGHIQINSGAYQYVKYGYKTTETATGPAITAEGSAKPEANYGGSIVNGAVATMAVWVKMTEQMMQDNANLVSFIDDDLRYQLNKKIDAEIVTGTGSGQLKGLNQSGQYADYITPAGLASGDTCIDLVLKVSSAMRAANIQNLTLLLNPMDWVKVVGAKNANKDYLIPGILDVPGQRIWGIPVVLSGSVASGKFHMGDFYQGAKVVERTGLGVEIARTEDDFLKNLYTLRVERRLDFAVVQPKCLAYGNFADVA